MSTDKHEDLVISLKVNVIKQRVKYEETAHQNAVLIDALFEAWQSFQPTESSVWKVVKSLSLGVKINSSLIGEKTQIQEYTNKSGKKHMAHYAHYGMAYLHPVDEKIDGGKPIFYVGNFWITNKNFKFIYNPKKAKCIEDYFVPFIPPPLPISLDDD